MQRKPNVVPYLMGETPGALVFVDLAHMIFLTLEEAMQVSDALLTIWHKELRDAAGSDSQPSEPSPGPQNPGRDMEQQGSPSGFIGLQALYPDGSSPPLQQPPVQGGLAEESLLLINSWAVQYADGSIGIMRYPTRKRALKHTEHAPGSLPIPSPDLPNCE